MMFDMTNALSNYAKNRLLCGRMEDGSPDGNWPFYEEGGITYMKYDAIRMENKTDYTLLVTYRYKGNDIYSMEQDGISFKFGNTLNLEGIEGRMEVRPG